MSICLLSGAIAFHCAICSAAVCVLGIPIRLFFFLCNSFFLLLNWFLYSLLGSFHFLSSSNFLHSSGSSSNFRNGVSHVDICLFARNEERTESVPARAYSTSART